MLPGGPPRHAEAMDTTTVNQPAANQAGPRPLSRPQHGRMLGGVAAGLADYLGVDVTLVRIVFAVLAFAGGAGVPLYLAAWLLIPEAGTGQSIASDLIGSRQAGRP